MNVGPVTRHGLPDMRYKENRNQFSIPSNSSISSFGDNSIGTYMSNGSANGRTIYQGPRGGRYTIDKNGNKQYFR